jgi:hypothetical protein
MRGGGAADAEQERNLQRNRVFFLTWDFEQHRLKSCSSKIEEAPKGSLFFPFYSKN